MATWQTGATLPASQPATLQHFLTERYYLYTAGPDLKQAVQGKDLWRGKIYHEPWTLREASLSEWMSTFVESHGLPTPNGPPLLYAADALDVWVQEFHRV
jgi:uncharacterized protein YqjF (DUF2071 family)